MRNGNNGWALEIEDLTVAYADKPVLWDIDHRSERRRQEHPRQGGDGSRQTGGGRGADIWELA
jgi:hypothetical protein